MSCKSKLIIFCVFGFMLAVSISSAQDDDRVDDIALDRGMVAEPTGALTLEEAAALALAHNPALRVFPWDVRAAEARALQASLWANPELNLEVEDVGLSEGPEERTRSVSVNPAGLSLERAEGGGRPAGFKEAEFTLRISQLFLLGGKRKKAVAVAERERDAAEWDYEIGRTNVLRDVARTYIAVLTAQNHVASRQRVFDLAKTIEQTITARVESGKISPIDQKRASVQTTAAEIDLGRSLRQLEQARTALAATWGTTTATFDRVTGELHSAADLPPLKVLLDRSETNPDMRRWQYEIARREAVLTLTKARRLPDLTASLGFVTQGFDDHRSRALGVGPDGFSSSRSSTRFDDSRDNRIEFEFSIPLPVFNRNQGNIREAEYLLSKASAQRYVALSDVKTAIASWYQEAVAAYEETVKLNEDALPVAEDAFESVRLGYDGGKFGYIEVLNAQSTLFDLRVRLLEAYSAYHQATVEIERLLGQPLDRYREIYGSSVGEEVNAP